ncbi:hypothetical protein U5N28_13500, partial [Lysinibacillus telephonicus]
IQAASACIPMLKLCAFKLNERKLYTGLGYDFICWRLFCHNLYHNFLTFFVMSLTLAQQI